VQEGRVGYKHQEAEMSNRAEAQQANIIKPQYKEIVTSEFGDYMQVMRIRDAVDMR
jgi:hypothetical protein